MANLDASAVAPEDRVRFYKLKVQSVFERVKKLQSKVDSDALADHSDSTLNVLLEHIDKLSHSFSKAHESLEELDFTEMSSNLRTDFDDLIMVMQSTIKSEVVLLKCIIVPRLVVQVTLLAHPLPDCRLHLRCRH